MLDALLRPKSIAVIGASRSANTIGHQILDNLVRQCFMGAVYADRRISVAART